MMQGLLDSLYKIYSDWRAPMADETEPRPRRAPPPPPRQSSRPVEPRPRHQVPPNTCTTVALRLPAPPRLIRPSEHLAMIERSERRPPPLVPSVTVIQGPRPVHRSVAPPQPKIPVPVSPPMQRLPQSRREIQAHPAAHAQPLALPPQSAVPAPALQLSAAPRTIVIHRPDAKHGFGFTLRHLIVYPPESLQELYEDARHLAVGAVGAPMDTIFVRSVRGGGPAAAAGLRAGDRVLAVNGEPVAGGARAPYPRVVQLVQREPTTLRLTVVPKDHDLLQRYFSEAAYNPESNQRAQEMPAVEPESRLFDAYRRPRALPAPRSDERYDMPRLMPPAHILRDSRRESDTSLPSSATESKDSLGSFDSNSTLTGRELDDSIILSRIRKSLEQKEAFLRRPSQPTGWVTPEGPPSIKQKEFYARPQKLQKPTWPPPGSPPLASSPPPSLIPQQPIERTKKGDTSSVDSGTFSGYGEVNGNYYEKKVKHEKGQFVSILSKIQETAPSIAPPTNGIVTNGTAHTESKKEPSPTINQGVRSPVTELQLVTARTRQLEAARGGGGRRTEAARSELARLSAPRLEPSVALRRREFEGRPRREARSLDVQPHRDLEHEPVPIGGSLSGNQLMITGSKHLHCPPPDGYNPETEKVQMRTRSNSTGSEGLPIRRHHASDGSHAKRRMGLNREQMEALNCEEVRIQRPTQLSLGRESASSSVTPSPTPSTPADSGFAEDSVTRRQKKDAQLGEEERAMRRVSYLKATWGDRLHLDSDPEPEDHHGLRIPEKKGEESSSDASIEPLEGDVQGNVQIKMVVSNGKRASDRSWKQVWAVLQGNKLYLYRHHPSQSPGAASSGGSSAESGSRDALDVRYSLAALADDYTKRKHVVRVTTAAGELLLQAEGSADAQRWLAALRRQSVEPPPAEPAPLTPAPSTATVNANAPASDCPSPLPPQRTKKIGRNRSPSAGPTTPTLPSSPKNKTWKGRMAKQLRRMHGGGATTGAGTGVGATACAGAGLFGEPLESCPTDPEHPLVPRAVTLPASAVETYGLRTVGVYRVPGNAGGVASLAAALARDEAPAEDARWPDVHLASSLLKQFLRRLPDPLLTAALYPDFIAADRAPDRAHALRRLVRALPPAHAATLRYLVRHLRRVATHATHNRMEARNLAIVFGPTLVRAAGDDMLAMVNDMSSQCRIIESFLNHYEWYFDEDGSPPTEPPPATEELAPAPAPSRDLLIHNVKKIEGKDVSTRDIVSSIISAANRKIQRKPRPKSGEHKKWPEKRSESSPPASPAASPLTSPPASPPGDYDARPRDKLEMESLVTRHTHTLTNFAIDGLGDLVSSLTSTFDQKLRTLHNSSPLDDIPYADEEAEASAGAAARARRLKAAWLARHGSTSSDEPPPPDPDSEKENRDAPDKAGRPATDKAGVGLTARADNAPRLQRSESLSKGERLAKLDRGDWSVLRRGTRAAKLKRKNGMPERGIKRRHTVGGTKDFDKDGWTARHTRTSSPDLTWPASLVPPPAPPLESHV